MMSIRPQSTPPTSPTLPNSTTSSNMSCQLECLPLAYGLSWFFPTNDDPKERQVEIAQVWDFLAQVGYFSGSSKKTVRDFLHTADQAARNNNMSFARVAKVMRFQLLKGEAKTFADTMLAMPHRYPNSNYYCKQLRVRERRHRLFQEAITSQNSISTLRRWQNQSTFFR